MRRLLLAVVCCLCLVPPARAQAQTQHDDEHGRARAEAVALHRLQENAATASAREQAQFQLAVALYQLKLLQGAFAIFSEIADHPNHARYSETLLWLAKLATDLPEPADVMERVGKYDDERIAKLDNPEQRELFWHLSYLLGRYRYRNRLYEASGRALAKVDPKSRYYAKAQFFAGIANVQLRHPVEAIQAFERILRTTNAETTEESDRMHELALVSIARTYYSTAARFDAPGASIDYRRLDAAIRYWNAVSVTSELWLDARFEQAWGYFMTGDYARALGNLHTVELDVFPHVYNPEAGILRSLIYVTSCQYEDATTLTARFHEKYQPLEKELAAVYRRLRESDGDEDDAFYRLLKQVRDGKANLSPRITVVLANALGDRQLLRHLQYVQMLDDELKRFGKMPETFRESGAGSDVKDAILLARDIAVRNTGQLTRERYQRALDDLREHLRQNTRLLEAALQGRRGKPDATLAPWHVSRRNAERNVVQPDGDHVLWPFEGELWPDETDHQQSIRSLCR